MADERDDGERSEDPTQKKLDEALERGDVAKSQEVNTWFVIAPRLCPAAFSARWEGSHQLRGLCQLHQIRSTGGPRRAAQARDRVMPPPPPLLLLGGGSAAI